MNSLSKHSATTDQSTDVVSTTLLEASAVSLGAILAGAAAAAALSLVMLILGTGLTQREAEKRVTDTFARLQITLRDRETAAKESADKVRKVSANTALWFSSRCSSALSSPALRQRSAAGSETADRQSKLSIGDHHAFITSVFPWHSHSDHYFDCVVRALDALDIRWSGNAT